MKKCQLGPHNPDCLFRNLSDPLNDDYNDGKKNKIIVVKY